MDNGEFNNGGGGAAADSGWGVRWRRHRLMEATQQLAQLARAQDERTKGQRDERTRGRRDEWQRNNQPAQFVDEVAAQ